MDTLVKLILITASILVGIAADCSNWKLQDECSSDEDCEAGLYCFSCPQGFSGSRCVRSTISNQFQILNDSLPFKKYAFLTTHNAYAIDGYPSHTGVPRLTFTDQEDSVTQQLNNGVRALMLDTYDFRGDLWLCHSFKGQCHDYIAFGPAIDTLKEVEAFLAANPSEIVTIILEDYVHATNGLTRLFIDSGLMKYWFPLSKMPKNDGEDGMKAGSCSNRGESPPLDDKSKSLVLVNYFGSIPMKDLSCHDNSGDLINMLHTCYAASGNRWANFVAVDYYKRSEVGGSFQAVDTLNGKLLRGCDDIHACRAGSTSRACSS